MAIEGKWTDGKLLVLSIQVPSLHKLLVSWGVDKNVVLTSEESWNTSKNYSENCLEPANKTKNTTRETSGCMNTLILRVLSSPHELSTVMPGLQPWQETKYIISKIVTLHLKTLDGFNLQFPTYIHSWQCLMQAFSKLQGSFKSWRALWKQFSSSSASLVIQLSHISAPEPQALDLMMSHGSFSSSYCLHSAMFQQQLCTPKAFQPAEEEPPGARRKQQPLPYPTQKQLPSHGTGKTYCKSLWCQPSELAFLHSQSHYLLPIYSCKAQPYECSKEVKPKGQSRVASTDPFFKMARHS